MKKIWQSILNFFGFGAEDQTSDENAKELMAWITSKQRMDLCTQQAFQAVQQREPLPPNGRPHPYEATIKADCLKVDSALTDSHAGAISEKFGDVQYLINLIRDGIATALSGASPQKIEMAVTGKIAQHRPEAEHLKSALDRAKDELRIFRGANALTRDAQQTDTRDALYIIGAFAFFEAVANMFFLRENLEGGMAIIVALAVAVINVLANVWFGVRYREKNHVDSARARKGKVYFFYALLMIILLNSFIAGYRLIANEITPEFLLESTILLVIGMALGIAAFNKGYALYDPYPDYGELAKKVEDCENAWKELRKHHANFCEETKQASIGAHKNIRDKIKSILNKITNEPYDKNSLEKIVNMYFCLSIIVGLYIFLKKYDKQETDIMTDIFNNIFDKFFDEDHLNKIKKNKICTIEKPYYSEKFILMISYIALAIVIISLFLFFAKRYKIKNI